MPPQIASSVASYLAQLPADRRAELERVREVVRQNLPSGYEEALAKGIIVYSVPLSRYPDTYNGEAMWYVALACQKNYLTLHLMNAYAHAPLAQRLRDGFKVAGKKLDMGKACIRFRSADDLALETIGEIVASTPLETFVAFAKAARKR